MRSAFDQYSESYDQALAEALSATGEDKEFFARGRINWLARCLEMLGARPRAALDYGCGIGSSAGLLVDLLRADTVLGVDPSRACIDHARSAYATSRTTFLCLDEYTPSGKVDVAYCNGVFHHISDMERSSALKLIRESLRPGGIFGFWENNPWNPGTRYVMSRVAFDRDARCVSPRRAIALLRDAGFEILRRDSLFYFPRWLGLLRPLEPALRFLPLGGQFQVLARRPSNPY